MGWCRSWFQVARLISGWAIDEDELSLTGNAKIRGDELRKLAVQRLSVGETI